MHLLLVAGIAAAACASADSADSSDSADASTSSGSSVTTDAGESAPTSSAGAASSSSDGDAPTGSADDGSTGADGGESGEQPTGDVWVDAAGTVLGLSRTLNDFRDDAVAGLITPDGASWQVVDDAQIQEVVALDRYLATAFYASMDCSGPPMFATGWVAEIRTEVVTSALAGDLSEVEFVVPEGVDPVPAEFASWVGDIGCVTHEHSDPPAALYRAEDIVLVEPPAFVAPLAVEYH
ncbi:MAG: hypothetical protein IPK74_34505 [Deltaproteobacteria bacterium]|nr:hypothetical protein [Deltaproteobacteria bacterium]